MRQSINILDEQARPGRTIWQLAWPTILDQLLITLVQYVNTAMVGSLGENATASIAVTSSSIWLINGIFTAMAVGLGVPIGRYIGAGEYEDAKKTIRQALIAIMLVGLAATGIFQLVAPHLPLWLGADPRIIADAAAYLRLISSAFVFSLGVQTCSYILRCSGDMRTPLFFNIATNVVNVILNFFLIYEPRAISIFGTDIHVWGANLGVRGAGIATAISVTFSGIMLIRALYRRSSPIAISLRDKLRFDKAIWKDMIKLGSPVAFERVSISLGQVFLTAMVTSLGTAQLAAHHLAITAESVAYMPAYGFSVAATTLVAQALGAKKPELAERYGKYCSISGVIFMSSMGVLLFFLSHTLVGLLTPVQEVIKMGGDVLRIEAFAQPFFGLAVIAGGILRAARDTKWPFYIALIGMWAVRLPLAYALTTFTALGLFGPWIAMVTDLVVRGIVSLFRLTRKKWLDTAQGAEAS